MINLVLLSGGSGLRLWPLSNSSRSKQFLKVLRNANKNHISMIQRVFSQIQNIPLEISVTIAASASQKHSIESQVQGDYSLVLEPERRDTAPAIMLSCAHLMFEQGAQGDDTVIVMPIDTYADQGYFDCIAKLNVAVQHDVSDLVLLGATPTYPSAKFGYILPRNRQGDVWPVASFKEKPDAQTAAGYIKAGGLWNCGVFAFRLGYMQDVLKGYYQPEDFKDISDHYAILPKNSFDYEIVEKASSISVIPYSGAWKDLGTWNTLTEEMADLASGRTVGIETCDNTHVINELDIPLVTLGLKDVAVVASPDGILVSDKNHSSHMKPYVEKVAESRPMYERRHWGQYRVLSSSVFADGSRTLVKELIIKSGRQISYQQHRQRTEVWTVVSGAGSVVLDEQVQSIEPHSVITIAPGTKHAITASSELHVIEVQLGENLIEDDIERFGNYWS